MSQSHRQRHCLALYIDRRAVRNLSWRLCLFGRPNINASTKEHRIRLAMVTLNTIWKPFKLAMRACLGLAVWFLLLHLFTEGVSAICTLIAMLWSPFWILINLALQPWSIVSWLWDLFTTVIALRIMWIALWYSTAVLAHSFVFNSRRREGYRLPAGTLSDSDVGWGLTTYAVVSFFLMRTWCSRLGWIGMDSTLLGMVQFVILSEGKLLMTLGLLRLTGLILRRRRGELTVEEFELHACWCFFGPWSSEP